MALSLSSPGREQRQEANSQVSSYKALSPFLRTKPDYLPKAPPSNIIFGVRISTYLFEGGVAEGDRHNFTCKTGL